MKREKREIIYSIVILIMVPLLMVGNTLLFYSSVRKLYNEDIRRKADLLNSVMAEVLRSDIKANNADLIKQKLGSIKKQQPEMIHLAVYVQKDNTINSLAWSDDLDEHVSSATSLQVQIVFEKKQAVAKFEKIETSHGVTQVWTVTSPLIDQTTNKVVAVVGSSMSTADSDELIASILNMPLIFGIVSVVVVMALLFRHLRFVEYARLLARQREINQTMNDFLSVATHELKAPTTIIKGYIANAMDDSSNPLAESTRQQLGVALAQTDRLNALVQDLLNVSRIEQGRVEYHLQMVKIADVLSPIIQSYQLIAKEKNITINYQADRSLMVYADAGRVQEIFTNLIDNAVKYSTHGTVDIKHQVNGQLVSTIVRDTGIGMSTEQRKRLFQRFYRVQDEQTKNIGGTGLGLWIIKQYVENMNGTIEVDSMAGVGSQFTVNLPLAK